MQRRYTPAALLILLIPLSISSCSSGPPALKLPNGALAGGTAQVTVNGSALGPIHDVECESIGKGLTQITIGSTDSRTTALLGADTPKAVAFNDVEGFSGGYWQGLQGSVRVNMDDQTYTLAGTAVGFNTKNPTTRTANDFVVKVAC
jgi:hypothetical protein